MEIRSTDHNYMKLREVTRRALSSPIEETDEEEVFDVETYIEEETKSLNHDPPNGMGRISLQEDDTPYEEINLS